MKKIVVLMALLLVPIVYSQLDWSVTDLRCGDQVLDKYELCEKDLENASRCNILAEKLGIDMGCWEQHCTCVPKINPTYCGNNRRDFNEMCDGTDADDKCPLLGEIMGNVSLKCNPKTCGCDITETIPADYSPSVVQQLVNATQTASLCGDKKVERNEDCDPPNTLCTTSTKETGVCTDKCKCVEPEMIGIEEKPVENVTPVTQINVTEVPVENVTVENVTAPPVEKKPGFFARLWAWIAGLFS